MTLSAALLFVAQIAVVSTAPTGDTIQAPSVRSPAAVTATTKPSQIAFDASRFDSPADCDRRTTGAREGSTRNVPLRCIPVANQSATA